MHFLRAVDGDVRWRMWDYISHMTRRDVPICYLSHMHKAITVQYTVIIVYISACLLLHINKMLSLKIISLKMIIMENAYKYYYFYWQHWKTVNLIFSVDLWYQNCMLNASDVAIFSTTLTPLNVKLGYCLRRISDYGYITAPHLVAFYDTTSGYGGRILGLNPRRPHGGTPLKTYTCGR